VRMTAEPFGALPNGSPVLRYTMRRPGGLTLRVLTYGGIVQSLEVPDASGRPANVVLGFASLQGYLAGTDHPYFGATIGRFANRIAGGRFTLDGTRHAVAVNAAGHCLHGGSAGFDKRLWRAEPLGDHRLRLSLTSPDGDQGFPGRLDADVTYCLLDSGVRLDFRATTDAPTVVNLTNHAYFNLAGEGSGSVEAHTLVIDADGYTPVTGDLIPTGEVAPVAGTPLDFRRESAVGRRLRDPHPQLLAARGYDHNYVLRGTGLRRCARVSEPKSGRVLEVLTDQPGVQLYAGNALDGSLVGTGGQAYRQGDGLALETQHYPDSPNHPAFPSTVLRPGQSYATSTTWQFSTI
jgi:aldose 1-epimerase